MTPYDTFKTIIEMSRGSMKTVTRMGVSFCGEARVLYPSHDVYCFRNRVYRSLRSSSIIVCGRPGAPFVSYLMNR